MDKQPEALRLADELERWLLVQAKDRIGAAAELRRLHAENQGQAERIERLEQQIKEDAALLRRALTYLEYASQQLPMIHASIVDPVIDELKDRLNEGR